MNKTSHWAIKQKSSAHTFSVVPFLHNTSFWQAQNGDPLIESVIHAAERQQRIGFLARHRTVGCVISGFVKTVNYKHCSLNPPINPLICFVKHKSESTLYCSYKVLCSYVSLNICHVSRHFFHFCLKIWEIVEKCSVGLILILFLPCWRNVIIYINNSLFNLIKASWAHLQL